MQRKSEGDRAVKESNSAGISAVKDVVLLYISVVYISSKDSVVLLYISSKGQRICCVYQQ
jgi:hypothetical protein